MISSIISLSFFVLALLSLLPGIISARKRFWGENIARIVLSAISAGIAYLITYLFAVKLSNALVGPVESLLASTPVDEFLKEIASAEGALAIILSIIVTPILFILVFVLFKLVLSLTLARPLTKLCLKIAGSAKKKDYITEIYPKTKEEKKDKRFSAPSAVLGALCGLLSFIILMIPVTGTFATVSSIGVEVTDEGAIYEDVYNASYSLSDNIATKVINVIPVWGTLSHYELNGEEINIAEEAHIVGVLLEALGEMRSKDEATIHHSAELFRELSALCPNSSLVPCLCADFINAASSHWLEGEDFNGIELPQISEDGSTDDIMSILVQSLNHSTTETMREDLATIANVMAIIAENAKLDETGTFEISSLLEDEKIIKLLSLELNNNERLKPVMSTLGKKQVETSGGILELPDKEDEAYQTVVDTIVTKYQESIPTDKITEESIDSLAAAVGETIKNEVGIELTESEKALVASTLISEFGSGAELTPDMVSDFIEQYRK